MIDCLNKFSLVSGLKLNLNKCELFPLKMVSLLILMASLLIMLLSI